MIPNTRMSGIHSMIFQRQQKGHFVFHGDWQLFGSRHWIVLSILRSYPHSHSFLLIRSQIQAIAPSSKMLGSPGLLKTIKTNQLLGALPCCNHIDTSSLLQEHNILLIFTLFPFTETYIKSARPEGNSNHKTYKTLKHELHISQGERSKRSSPLTRQCSTPFPSMGHLALIWHRCFSLAEEIWLHFTLTRSRCERREG